jgi:hypothetical protein
MARTLKALTPEQVQAGKAKMMLSGKSGVGKTWAALDFPQCYYMDCEGGAAQPQYRKKLKDSGGVYFGREQGAGDFNTVLEEIEALATVQHDYRTLVIDSFSKLYLSEAAAAEAKVNPDTGKPLGSDYGRDKKEANRPTRQLIRWIGNLDMNVILICHSKDKWGGEGKERSIIGTTFDGYDKLEYELDLWMELEARGQKRVAMVKKSRVEGLELGSDFEWSFAAFAKRFGNEGTLTAKAKPITLATQDQLEEIDLLNGLITEEQRDKYFKKAGVEKWSEMKSETLSAIIALTKKNLEKKETK